MNSPREPRDRYAAAGKAGRETIERAVTQQAFLKPRDYRVLLACLALTALYSRTKEETSVGQIAGLSGLSYARTSESLVRLDDAGVIAWRGTRNRGSSHVSLVGAKPNTERLFRRKLRRGLRAIPDTAEQEDICSF